MQMIKSVSQECLYIIVPSKELRRSDLLCLLQF